MYFARTIKLKIVTIEFCLAYNNRGILEDVSSPDNPLESRFPVVRRLRRGTGESLKQVEDMTVVAARVMHATSPCRASGILSSGVGRWRLGRLSAPARVPPSGFARGFLFTAKLLIKLPVRLPNILSHSVFLTVL